MAIGLDQELMALRRSNKSVKRKPPLLMEWMAAYVAAYP
jgi:hypothetical protein